MDIMIYTIILKYNTCIILKLYLKEEIFCLIYFYVIIEKLDKIPLSYYCSFFFIISTSACTRLNFCSCNRTLKNPFFFFLFFLNKIYLTQGLIHLIENQFFNKEQTHILFHTCLDKSYSIKTSALINMYAFILKTILIANSVISNIHCNKTRIKLCFLFILLSYKLVTRLFYI